MTEPARKLLNVNDYGLCLDVKHRDKLATRMDLYKLSKYMFYSTNREFPHLVTSYKFKEDVLSYDDLKPFVELFVQYTETCGSTSERINWSGTVANLVNELYKKKIESILQTRSSQPYYTSH